ncbi:siroheme synthase middle domains-like protein [Hypoxylon trugodes]|uniref:siroheme synthase middle domains-like protein n=1 Tax=Hypoxylon trugodes TaxID=326681 RepID=UPI0021A1C9C5|nr:siroheme synthase middle domains-like protein [Hypoxylon trugodes]KAI1383807.1 siroheme synthase middle domains-like protein [Hypoxylon trugodes]
MASNDNNDQFPKVQGGGSLILAWQVKNKHVLVVGGGEVAAGRILNVLNANANVTVISPSSGLNPEVRHRIANDEVTHIDRVFEPSDLEILPPSNGPPDMVLVAIDDPDASTQIWKLCKEHRIPANIADVPPECDFYFGSVHRDGPLQIMVSTNGKGPRLAASIRKWIGTQLPVGVGDAIERMGVLRTKLRQMAPSPEEGPGRMKWISKISDAYSWDDMCSLTDEDMDNLLTFYAPDKVPHLDMLKAMRGGRAEEDIDVFDGSFGFSVVA